MKNFMDGNFLLQTETSQKLYHEHAAKMPIIDYHCHLIPQMVAEDYQFKSLTEIWLGGDHYKWRAMRTNGVDERFCTGKDTTDWEKFEKWAETVPYTFRNPLYHWTHLELKTAFGIDKILNPHTAREIYDECNEKLKQPEYSARGMMRRYHVEVVCTTDDPIDSLEYHIKTRESGFEIKMLPTWRPDKAMAVEVPADFRAFVDWIIYNMNQKTDFNSNVVVVQPIDKGMVNMLNAQDDLYHVNLQGLDKGETINSLTMIDVISRALNPYTQNDEFMKLAEQPEMRFVISNTTEAGIAFDPACKLTDTPASSYPGKLTQLLYHRFKTFNGDKSKGLIIFPCELIFLNGHKLKETIYQYIELWQLGDEFRAWFEEACGVYATLVDRIVPGFPHKDIAAIKEKIQYDDNLVVQAEIFHLWVIEAPQEVAEEFPADKAGLNVLFVPSEEPYHERKVTLLNGPHTVLSPVAYLSEVNIVRDACQHPIIGQYIHKVMFDELMETLNLPKNELKKFAEDVLERFNNPFVDHAVTSIMLNSFPKYQTRDLPGLKTYLKRKGELPKGLVLGLAAIITYYKGGTRADGTEIIPNDAPEIMQLLKDLWATGDTRKVAEGVLAAKDLIWGEHGDLNTVPGLTDMITCFLKSIQEKGMQETVKGIL